MDWVDMKKEVLDCFLADHVGRGNAVHSRVLERKYSLNGRTLRNIVHELRQQGHPICSDSTGYYYAANQDEIENAAARLGALASKIASAQDALMNASRKGD